MKNRYITAALRKFVTQRAEARCEYCRAFAENSFFTFHIEHIISIKHGGTNSEENLALSCPICNVNKGSDIGTFVSNYTNIIRFFNPRTDVWDDHFSIENTGLIVPKTDIATATIKILDLNHPDSIIERCEMIASGIF